MTKNHMKLSLVIAASAVLLAGSAATSFAQYFTIGSQVWASDVTNDGVVVGYITQGPYYTWTQSQGLVNIGGKADAGQPAISSDGNLIGANAINPATATPDYPAGLAEAAQYNRASGTWSLLGSLGNGLDSNSGSHWGMNGAGTVSVGLAWAGGATAHAVRYNIGAGTVTDLGSTTPGRSSRANAVNGDGSIIVGWQDNEFGGRQGAIWTNGVQTLLSNDIDMLGEAGAVTPDGQWVIGGSGYGAEEAWRYHVPTGELNYFGTVDPNAFFPTRGATGISDDGSIVVGFERGFPPSPLNAVGYIWIEGQGTLNLTDYVTSLGIDLGGRRLATPLGISGDGTHIVGMASDFTGFLVVIPEPASASLLALGGALLGRRRR